MKFLHTSDWHLGRQFHNVSLLDDQQVVLNQLLNYLRENPVDALVVAGDIYDRSVPSTRAITLLNQVVDEVCGKLSIPMIVIPGNHDSAERLGFAARQMKQAGLHIISNFSQMLEPVIIHTQDAGDVAFYGMPYHEPEQVRAYFQQDVSSYDDAMGVLCTQIRAHFQPHQRRVLLSHCFVDGAIESESERPLSIGGSDRVSHEHFLAFDYVALGHLHQPQFKGAEHIRYSGSLMKYSFSEQHQKKGMTLVTLGHNGVQTIEHIPLHAPHQMRILEGKLEALLSAGADDKQRDDYLLVRLLDEHAILNPMEKLRRVYPNVLHLEKPGMLIGVEQSMAKARLARSERDMFNDFFLEAQQRTLNDAQSQAISDIISQLIKEQ